MKGFIDSPLEGVRGETKGEKRESNTTFETADLVDEFPWENEGSVEQQERSPNPLEDASPLSRLFFLWTPALFGPKGKKEIHERDLPEIVANKDGSQANLRRFQDLWNEEKSRASQALANRKANEGGDTARPSKKSISPSLKNALSSDWVRNSKRVQPFLFLSSASKLIQALSLGLLLQSFEDDDDGQAYFFWTGLLVLSSLFFVLSHHQIFQENSQIGMRLRASVISALYDKSLLLKSGIVDGSCNTDVLSLVANDAERYILAANYGMYKFWSPITAIGALSIGCSVVGWSFAIGFFVLVFMLVPTQLYLIKRFCTERAGVAAITDGRIGLVSQFVEEAKVWKMMDYTSLFLDQMSSIRKCEVNNILHINRYRAMNEALFFLATVVTSVIVFLVQVYSGRELSTLSVFTTLALINVLFVETKHMTWGVMGIGDATVSTTRIQRFLTVENRSSVFDPIPCDDKAHTISLSHVTAHWQGSQNTSGGNEGSSVVALDDVTLDFGAGLSIVIGGCGSGKSALLHLLANELPTSSGAYRRKEGTTVAYFTQQPWLFAGSIYENILFGLPYDEIRYREAIQASCLASDLECMEEGDETPVGERGLNLSGGQRARVALARTLYRDTDIILLDDPFAAVDSKVANGIYKSIKNVAQNKCVILVTHQLRHITDELCILMDEGRVLCVGSLSTVADASKGKIAMDVASGGSGSEGTDAEESPVQPTKVFTPVVSSNASAKVSTVSKPATTDSTEVSKVTFATFKNYCVAAGGLGPILLIAFFFTASQASIIATIRMAGWWATVKDQTDSKVVSTVVAMVLSVILFSIARALYYYRCVITASKVLHDRMSRSVMLAAASFFDTNTAGNILNRFSADTGSNDDVLPNTLYEVFMIMFMAIGVLVATALVLPVCLIAVPVVALGVCRLRAEFIVASLQLKGLETQARSPILSALNESLCGIMTIRANDASELFRRRFFEAHDAHTRATFASTSVNRWFGFYMDLIMCAYISVVSVSAALFHDRGWATFTPEEIGISLVLSVQLASIFGYGVRQSAEAENLFLSVQRVLDYCGVSSEAPLSTEDDSDIASDWPTVGAIDVKELSVRYREGQPLSLKSLTFQVDGGTRVGVVGRTGSGKSTLINSLVRLLEAENGQITIDGVDIATLGLSKLRNSISVISQTPVLHGGISLRRNLDPSQAHKDDEIREALLYTSMLDVVDSLPIGLDTVVNDEGANSCFSVGERQLFTLSRSLLEKKKILVLDEATANIDNYTEKKLQQVVSKLQDCTGCTILSIAHRLDTIIDHDKVLVLGNGCMLEFGSPHQLIQEKGAFFEMVQETGNGEALAARAKRSCGKLQFNRASANRLLMVK